MVLLFRESQQLYESILRALQATDNLSATADLSTFVCDFESALIMLSVLCLATMC